MARSIPGRTGMPIGPPRTPPCARGVTLLALVLGLLPLAARAVEPPAGEVEFFESSVRPLLVEKCLKCHGDKAPKGGLRLTSRAGVLKGGDGGPAATAGLADS